MVETCKNIPIATAKIQSVLTLYFAVNTCPKTSPNGAINPNKAVNNHDFNEEKLEALKTVIKAIATGTLCKKTPHNKLELP